jgi:fatty acid desaturase
MVPDQALLPDVLPTNRLIAGGKPVRGLRTGLRRLSDFRSALTVTGAVAQTYGVVAVAGYLDRWWACLAAFVLMIRGHALLNILAHEAAHRLLFTRQWLNDAAGRWLLAYPSLQAMLAYRRAHFAHHRDEMGPGEPDLGLYRGYPISRASFRRKLTRDALGVSAYKNLKLLARAVVRRRTEALQIVAVQAMLLAISLAWGRPWMYLVWFLSWSTGWKVSNRLRALAEHGGMTRSKDRRETTHVVHQSRAARFWIVPYHTGWHLAHHVDMGVPWRNLPRLHRELVDSGWLVPGIEYPSYRALWRALASGSDEAGRLRPSRRLRDEATTSFLSIG